MDGGGDYLEIDLEDLTVGEIEIIEDVIGGPIDRAFLEGAPKGKALRALGYVVRRRTNPEFTLEDAGNLKIRLAETPEADPTSAAG